MYLHHLFPSTQSLFAKLANLYRLFWANVPREYESCGPSGFDQIQYIWICSLVLEITRFKFTNCRFSWIIKRKTTIYYVLTYLACFCGMHTLSVTYNDKAWGSRPSLGTIFTIPLNSTSQVFHSHMHIQCQRAINYKAWL